MFGIIKRMEERFGFTEEERAKKNIKIRERIEERKKAHLDIVFKSMIFVLISTSIFELPIRSTVFAILLVVLIVTIIIGIPISYRYAKKTDELIEQEDGPKADGTPKTPIKNQK